MVDFDREFRALDRLPRPDLSPEIQRRTTQSEIHSEPRRPREPQARGSRLVAAVVALVVAAGAVFVLIRLFHTVPQRVPASDPWSSMPQGWTRLSPLPADRNGHPAFIWTGREFLFWGGDNTSGTETA